MNFILLLHLFLEIFIPFYVSAAGEAAVCPPSRAEAAPRDR